MEAAYTRGEEVISCSFLCTGNDTGMTEFNNRMLPKQQADMRKYCLQEFDKLVICYVARCNKK